MVAGNQTSGLWLEVPVALPAIMHMHTHTHFDGKRGGGKCPQNLPNKAHHEISIVTGRASKVGCYLAEVKHRVCTCMHFNTSTAE